MSGILITTGEQPDGSAVRMIFDTATKHLVVERWETRPTAPATPNPGTVYVRVRYRAEPVPVEEDEAAHQLIAASEGPDAGVD